MKKVVFEDEEYSYGGILYQVKDGKILYLIIESLSGFWGFPKGHIEKNETKLECAIREIKEETGVDAKIISDKCFYESFYMRQYDKHKTVGFYVGKFDGDIKIQKEEIKSYKVLPFNEALKYLIFRNTKRIFSKANKLITRHEMYNEIIEGLDDVKNGNVVDGPSVLKELNDKYGSNK